MFAKVLGQAVLGLAFLIGGTGAVCAGSFSVSPVRATLSVSQSVGMLTVHNSGATPAVIQLEALQWSQQDGKDIYAPTRDVLATPPIFTVPPQGKQIIRVGLRGKPDASVERSYRLFLREVPPPPAAGQQGLQIALHMSLPVFVAPLAPAKPVLTWQARHEANGQLRLRARNSGNSHVQITNLRLLQSDGIELTQKSMADYLLPGQERSWSLMPAKRPGATLRLQAQTDAGPLQSEVAVE